MTGRDVTGSLRTFVHGEGEYQAASKDADLLLDSFIVEMQTYSRERLLEIAAYREWVNPKDDWFARMIREYVSVWRTDG